MLPKNRRKIEPGSAALNPHSTAAPGSNGRGNPPVELNPWREAFSQPWLRWFAVFSVGAILIAVIALTRPAIASWIFGTGRNNPAAQTSSASSPEESAQPLPTIARPGTNPFIAREIVSHSTEPADFRRDVISYTVQAGDYLFAIADKFKITPETILWSNYAVLKDNPELILPGQELFILPVDGLYYQWQAGDRLDTVAATFGVAPEDIILWPGNSLAPTVKVQNPDIVPGTWLVVPGGHREFKEWEMPVIRKTDITPWVGGGSGACHGPFSGPAGTGMWIWPTASHWVVGNEYTAYHHGIDLYIRLGDPIYAADRGVVVFAGWSDWGYGNLVVVDHGNGWQTVYGHFDSVSMFCGAIVNRGDILGAGGTTGHSTGPHLHFEMIYNGVRVNPHDYLP
jgi:murein DD-endopeptidase MepM/ murein hydrolase activator NlpD